MTEVLCQLRVVELEPEPVLPDGHAEREEQQQARQPEPRGGARGRDAGQHHRTTGEQRDVQLRKRHCWTDV
jgi:hypothetical protein